MWRSMVVKNILFSWEMTKMNILAAMEFRASFLTQVIGMIVNDIALISIWVIFFNRFPQVHGWTFNDSATLFAITTVTFGVVMIFTRGAFELAKTITKGELDYFLALPKNILWHVAFSKTEMSAIGDFLFGLLIFFFSGDVGIPKALMFIYFTITSSVILFSFIIITQSLAFWFGNFEEAAVQLFDAIISFTLYPQTVFYGILKILMVTIIPAFFMATIPVDMMRSFNPVTSLALIPYSLIVLALAVFVFNKGLKRYESGNLINLRA